MPSELTTKRSYLQHGHYALSHALDTLGNRDGWVESLGDVGEVLTQWRAASIEDLGGDSAVSAMGVNVSELATNTHLLLEQTSLVNKSKGQLFPIVLQRQQLADALARYMGLLGLKQRAKPTASLADYLATKSSGPTEASTGNNHEPEAQAEQSGGLEA
jgi:hypothetical protein